MDPEASSSTSAPLPRRSTRASNSASNQSSVEPQPEAERRQTRLRKRANNGRVHVQTGSDDDVIAQGGITRSKVNKFSRAFEASGFEALSWAKDKERIAREFAPVTERAEDIPHELQDHMNASNEVARRAALVAVFEAAIKDHTARDEPYAPPIRIINDVDLDPAPPLEFHYSNQMWHGQDVPKPDYDTLQGCGCRGPCNPKSKTCACIKKQKNIMRSSEPFPAGFMYKDGRLLPGMEDYPVVECNMKCGCSDDCPNRVSWLPLHRH